MKMIIGLKNRLLLMKNDWKGKHWYWIAGKPGKTLLHMFVSSDMRLSRGMEIGVDAACGDMSRRGKFQTEKYVGIDLDHERLQQGMLKYPEASTICSRIEEVSGLQGDVVLCVQTINTNRHFDPSQAIPTIEALCGLVRAGGYLFFNVGSKGPDLKSLEPEIDRLLRGKFSKIIKRRYGAFHRYKTRRITSLFLASAMYMIPSLRTINGRYRKLYYSCREKI